MVFCAQEKVSSVSAMFVDVAYSEEILVREEHQETLVMPFQVLVCVDMVPHVKDW